MTSAFTHKNKIIMTAKEKAESLFKKHLTAISEETMDSENIIRYNAKQCALVTVQQVWNALPDKTCYEHGILGFWGEVKKELECL